MSERAFISPTPFHRAKWSDSRSIAAAINEAWFTIFSIRLIDAFRKKHWKTRTAERKEQSTVQSEEATTELAKAIWESGTVSIWPRWKEVGITINKCGPAPTVCVAVQYTTR